MAPELHRPWVRAKKVLSDLEALAALQPLPIAQHAYVGTVPNGIFCSICEQQEDHPAHQPPAGKGEIAEMIGKIIERTVDPAPTSMPDRKVLDWVNGQARLIQAAQSSRSQEGREAVIAECRKRIAPLQRDDCSADWNLAVFACMNVLSALKSAPTPAREG